MENNAMILGVAAVIAVLGFVISYFIGKKSANTKILEAELKAKDIISEAEKDAEKVKQTKIKEAKADWRNRREEFESDTKDRKKRIDAQEKDLVMHKENVEKKLQTILNKEKSLQNFEKNLNKKNDEMSGTKEKIDQMFDEKVDKLEKIAGLTKDEAKQR